MHMRIALCMKVKLSWVLFILTTLHTRITTEVSPVQTVVGLDANFSFLLNEDPGSSIVRIKDKNGVLVVSARGNWSTSDNPMYSDRVNFTGNTNQKLISFILRNVTLVDAGMYNAVIGTLSNLEKTIGSQLLIVKASPSKPQIVELSGLAVIGSYYYLNCSAQSSSEPPNHNLSMFSEWRRDNMLLNSSGRYFVNRTELTITDLSYGQDNGARLTCVAFEDILAKSVNSDEYIIDVKYGPDNIQLNPSSDVITERENGQIILNCTADCNPPCSFQWRKELVPTPLANSQTLILNTVSKNDTGHYLCSISNNIIGISQTAQITIMIIYGPENAQIVLSPSAFPLKVEENATLNITCSADCYPDCNFTWIGPQGYLKTGAQLSRIIDRDKGGNYSCIATNQVNLGKTATVSVMMLVLYGPGNSVNLGSIPQTLGVDLHQTAPDITCNATCNPPCDYRWYQNGTIYRNGATLSLGVVEKTTRGNYRCEAYNSVLGVNRSSSTSVSIIVYSHNTTTAPLVLQRSDVECQTTSLKIFVPKNLVPGNGTVTWRDSACVVHSNGTHFVDSVGLRDCGTTLTLEADSVVFENDLILHKNGTQMQNGNNIVTYGSDYEFAIPVKCVYPRNSNISTSYIPIVQQVRIMERRNGQLDLTMRQYEAEDYSHPVPFNAYPRQVPLNNDIFIRLAMENNVTGLGLSADNCFATSTPSPVDQNWYQLISSGCPVNNAKIHPSGINDVKFSFHAFNFRHNTSGIVYVHCQVSVCLDTDPACVVGCMTRKKRSASAREGTITSNLISTGPFILTADEGGVAMSTVVAAVSIAVAVIATVVAIIGWTRKSKKGADS